MGTYCSSEERRTKAEGQEKGQGLTSTDPKWQLAKLLHPTPDEDAWVVQWCNLARPDQSPRMDGKFVLVWRGEDGEEKYAMNARPGWVPLQWVITLLRIITPCFQLAAHGKLPAPQIKAVIKSKFESKYY